MLLLVLRLGLYCKLWKSDCWAVLRLSSSVLWDVGADWTHRKLEWQILNIQAKLLFRSIRFWCGGLKLSVTAVCLSRGYQWVCCSLPTSHCLYSFYLLPVLVHTAIASSASGLELKISSMAALWHFHCRFIPCSPALFLTELLSSPSSYSHIVYSHLPSHRLCFSLVTCLYWFSPTENCYFTFSFSLTLFSFSSSRLNLVLSSQAQMFLCCPIPLNSSLISVTQL